MSQRLPRRPAERRGLRLWPVGIVLILAFSTAVLVASSVFYSGWELLGARELKPEHRIDSKTLFELVKLAFGVVAGSGALVALVVAYRRQRVDEDGALRDTTRLHTERFTTAVSQLGDESAAVRLGGVHALAGLADDAPNRGLRQTCIDVLCAYLRLPYTAESDLPANDAEARHAYLALREVRRTIVRLIRDHLRLPLRHHHSWQGHDFDFTGVIFSGEDFSESVFSGGTVDFGGATFSGNAVDFSESVFSGGTVRFGGSRFSAADFSGSRFSGSAVDFSGSRFADGAVDFGGATFSSGTVRFGASVFSGGAVDFGGSTFSGGQVHFSRSTFSGGTVDYVASTFSGGAVDFGGASFSGGTVRFGGTEFSGSTVHFDGSAFASGAVEFGGSTFSGGTVHFNRTTFSGGTVQFRGTAFSGSGAVEFSGSTFSGGTVHFGGSTFSSGAVDFSRSTFSGSTVDFSRSRGVAPPGLLPAAGSPLPYGLILPTAWQPTGPPV
ncbi:pentapeptide repeat-containing protein [Streptomyces sp. NPDC001868]|uniref:pentapeptide repeat-containing protein n=1 Tax=Streptomyces sp. NPDC001868 TaxID=3154401 RepID=UPI00331DB863